MKKRFTFIHSRLTQFKCGQSVVEIKRNIGLNFKEIVKLCSKLRMVAVEFWIYICRWICVCMYALLLKLVICWECIKNIVSAKRFDSFNSVSRNNERGSQFSMYYISFTIVSIPLNRAHFLADFIFIINLDVQRSERESLNTYRFYFIFLPKICMVVRFWIRVTAKYCHANNIGYAARKFEDGKKKHNCKWNGCWYTVVL